MKDFSPTDKALSPQFFKFNFPSSYDPAEKSTQSFRRILCLFYRF